MNHQLMIFALAAWSKNGPTATPTSWRATVHMSEWTDRPMKDINKVGPSDERQAKLNKLMDKLRERGSVGTTSLTASGRSDGMYVPVSTPVVNAEQREEEALPGVIDVLGETDAQALDETQENESTAQQGKPDSDSGDEVPKTTSGIGGSWSPPSTAEVEKLKPKVPTWGVFERPADISKAYGGGRQVGVGGYQESEQERLAKRDALAKQMEAYRRANGIDQATEDKHVEEQTL